MSGADERRVPAREGRGEVREKASRFFAVAARADSADAAEAVVAALRREHHAATHVAFAWRVGAADAAVRRSDAGEPAGTAGPPIAGAIDSAGLTDVAVAVARYFGGTKLGTGGLARAYRLAAGRAIAACGSEIVHDVVRVRARCPFDRTGALRRLIDPPHVRLVSEAFAPEPAMELEVRRSRLDAFVARLVEERLDYEICDL